LNPTPLVELLLLAAALLAIAVVVVAGRRLRKVRVDRYHLMREFFRGGDALAEHAADLGADRLHPVSLAAGAAAGGRTLAQVDPAQDRVVVTALVHDGKRTLEPAADTRLAAGDVRVLFGAPADLERAEARLTAPAAGQDLTGPAPPRSTRRRSRPTGSGRSRPASRRSPGRVSSERRSRRSAACR
jgi:hypothetical protein